MRNSHSNYLRGQDTFAHPRKGTHMTEKDTAPTTPMDTLTAHGRETARGVVHTGSIRGKRLAGVVAACLRRLGASHKKTVTTATGAHALPGEMEWFLDNWYIAEREGKEAALRLADAKRLRNSRNGAMLFVLAQGLVEAEEGTVTPASIRSFFDGVQQVKVLREDEVSLLVPALKAALVLRLGELTAAIRPEETPGLSGQMERVFTSLRLLASLDMTDILDEISRTEQTLRQDPAGVYCNMDEKTRIRYRRQVSRLARKHRLEEYQVAEKVLEQAEKSEGREGHVGYFLFNRPMGAPAKRRQGGVYIGGIVLSSLFFSVLAAVVLRSAVVALLLVLPISEIMKNLFDFFVIKCIRPQHVPRLGLEDGVPVEGRTLCIISALLDSTKAGSEYAARLEEYYLANRDCGPNLLFGILADFPESEQATIPDAKAWVETTGAALEGLGKKYGTTFLLFHRERVLDKKSRRYRGWERKRGAILELSRLLADKPNNLELAAGTMLQLEGVRYVITLDSDTRLNVGAAREMIGAMLHPLNAPVVDRASGVVREGCALMQPRIGVDLKAAGRSDFSRIFAGQGGIDPYGSAASDVYQDLFGEGSFTGKGIFDVAAFSICLDQAFPENRVLSHDLLEGAYLRAAYLGDVELTDGYPYKVLSYFARMHRWTRGDWQSAPWMFRRVPKADGKRTENPLSPVSRWKIFDNLRRSMVPVFTMLALLAAMFISMTSLFWAGVVAILSPLSALLISSAELMFRRDTGPRVRYHSTIISGFTGGFLETMSQLILLPYHAFICLSGALTALWRMLVSRRNMLAWVTAADTERRMGTGVFYHYYKMFPAVVVALAAILLSGTPLKIIVGIVWLASPLYALGLSRERRENVQVTDSERQYLQAAAEDIWRYFEDFLSPEDHFLPPDNWQEQPAAGVAHRTSPTNIGLGLLSCLAAMDLGLCPKHRALGYIENMLATMERMEKWNGHLYNWYDTRTLRPLRPVYVSSVDSGNLSGALLVLREGLYEMGQRDLGQRADRLFADMGFSSLYDKRRRLFHIGWDLEKGGPTEGWYDLLASEARQTSYIAIARGDIEPRHWRRLGRALVSQDKYSGMASWTGTAFEYLMPLTVMPCYPDSLLYESLKFSVHVQKKRHTPWGISESAFYAFDPDLNYSYKAHGVQRLALRRGMNKEIVVSSYSTFLALPLDVRGSVQNLRRLEKLGAKGKYGFYEALDFTPNRAAGQEFQIVKAFMAHHLGMSLLAIDNVLTGNAMQERFMRDRAMSAYRELLQEKVPIGQIVLRQPPREVPDKPRRLVGAGWSAEHTQMSPFRPACGVLSNGAYNVVVTETGHARSMAGEVMVTRFQPRQDGAVQGMGFYLKTEGEILPLQAAPNFSEGGAYAARFTGGDATLTFQQPGLEAAITISVPSSELGELRRVEVKNQGGKPLVGELICYAEPVLKTPADYFAHPAFSKLSMETELTDGALVVRRRSNGVRPASYLAFAVTEGFAFDTSREKALGRHGLTAAIGGEAAGSLGTVLDPCILVRVPVEIPAGETKAIGFALAVGKQQGEAIQAAKRIVTSTSGATEPFVERRAMSLGIGPEELTEAMATVPDLIYPFTGAGERGQYITPQSGGPQELWPFGISGDMPLITAHMRDDGELGLAGRLIRQHSLLHQCGLKYDLVFLVQDSGDYRRPLHSGLRDMLSDMGLESFQGARGGIHLVDGTGDIRPILAASAEVYDGEVRPVRTSANLTPTAPVGRDIRIAPLFREQAGPACSYAPDGAVVIETAGGLPPNTWSQMLTNGNYGYIATESGTGHMWQKNARENKLTPWQNDTLETKGAERLTLLRGGTEISLFADTDGYPCRITYGFGYARWEKTIEDGTITVTAFVPPDTEARVFLVEGDLRPGDKVAYFAELILGADDRHRAYVVTTEHEGALTAQNGSNGEFPDTALTLVAGTVPEGYTCDRHAWARRTSDNRTGAGLDPCFYAVYPGEKSLSIVTGTAGLGDLRQLTNLDVARQALTATKHWWQNRIGGIRVQTGVEAVDHLLSGWALYQSLACRVMGRSSVYQCGGAYGFRDQLQDATALIAVTPQITAEILRLAAAHQFEEGDVQHWWHPSGLEGVADKGVRTRCSDDLLFLPYVLCEYVEKTGDVALCDANAPYIRSPILEAGEHERYESPNISDLQESLFQHAKRAVDLVLRRGAGRHGLILVGTGDWNDGMNLVGAGGQGESVWLTWFFAHVLERFAALCTRLGETEQAAHYQTEARRWAKAADEAWDGGWYLRGYYDNGKTLGSGNDAECQIDAIAQGWATMTPYSDPQKVKTALHAAITRLFEPEAGLVRLFDPAFDRGPENPGYIRGYAPGLRENGGQYTHGILWLIMGAFRAGLTEEAYTMLQAITPGHHDRSVYRGEPYVLSADVYSNPQHMGRAGWTWYTGASGWYWRVAMENLLGLHLRDGKLYIEPNLPKAMPGYVVEWKAEGEMWRIEVEGERVMVNGKPYDGKGLSVLEGDREGSPVLDSRSP
ncbi:MAG: hypothetical protein FWE28_03425 [Oscillospiraceae bacterium]|nr:hypothetical protein [Oscillospiraceae bacterium]